MLLIAFGGARRDRTVNLLRARQALYQLSYGPLFGGLQSVVDYEMHKKLIVNSKLGGSGWT